MLKKIISILALSLMCLALSAQDAINGEYLSGLGDKKSYKLIVKENTAEACVTFLSTFPESRYKDKASNLYDELSYIAAYDKATSTFDVKDLKAYLVNFSNGKFRTQAGEAIDIISWQKARSENTLWAYEAYIKEFPSGKAVPLARKAMEGL